MTIAFNLQLSSVLQSDLSSLSYLIRPSHWLNPPKVCPRLLGAVMRFPNGTEGHSQSRNGDVEEADEAGQRIDLT